MKKASVFFDKFLKIVPPEKSKKKSVVKVIEQITGIKIKENQVSVNPNSIYLDVSSVEKAEILMCEKKIIEVLNKKYNFNILKII